jgi:hypothetical protein
MLDIAEAAHGKRMENLKTVIQPLIGSEDAPKNSEAIFGKLTAMAGSKSNADIDGLKAVVSQLPDESKGDLAAGVIHNLGNNNGHFSPSTFATNWSKLSDDGKATLFAHNPELAGDLDASANVAKQMQANSAFYNHSNSAHGYAGLVIGEKAADVPIKLVTGKPVEAAQSGLSLVASFLGVRAAAKALATPGVVSVMDAYGRTGNLGAAVAALRQVARNNPDAVSYIGTMLGRLRQNAPPGMIARGLDAQDYKNDVYPTLPSLPPTLPRQQSQ